MSELTFTATRIVTDADDTIYISSWPDGTFQIDFIDSKRGRSSEIALTRRDMDVLADAVHAHQAANEPQA